MCHRDPVEVKRLRIEAGNLRAQVIALTDSLRLEDERHTITHAEKEQIVSTTGVLEAEYEELEEENQDLRNQLGLMDDYEEEIRAHRLFRAHAEKIFEDLKAALDLNPDNTVWETMGHYKGLLDWKEPYRPHPGVLPWDTSAQQRFFEQNRSYDPASTSWEEFDRNML